MENKIIDILQNIIYELREMNQGLEAMGEFCKDLDKEIGIQQIQIQQIQNELREMKHLNLPKFNI